MIIDIICPIYNAEKYIEKLHKSFLMQKKVNINEIKYILTESDDETEEILKKNKIKYKKIKRQDFSHSIVREKAAYDSKADIVVFVTQDVVIENDDWLYKLTKDINNEIVATYSRQLTKYEGIEKYTRLKNYPKESKVVSKNDLEKLGLRTFFFSDASSAINLKIFKKLNGYDKKNLPTNEDMYIAYKIIMNNYKIKYCSDSIVFHSHKFSLKELYDRYKLTGKFMKENKYLDVYGTKKEGSGLAKFILKELIKDKDIKSLIRFPFDMGARYIGMKVGKKL